MVSDQKKARVIDSIKKLVALGVSEKEIVGNLTDVGINVTEAKILINEAKGVQVPGKKPIPKLAEKNLYDSQTKNLSIDDQIAGQLNIKTSQIKSSETKGVEVKTEPMATPEELTKNLELGLQVKSVSPKETAELKQDEMASNRIGEEVKQKVEEIKPIENKVDVKKVDEKPVNKPANKEVPKKKFGLFGKKLAKDPIAELQKELNISTKKPEQKVEPIKKVEPKTKPFLGGAFIKKVEPVSQQSVVEEKIEEKIEKKVEEKVAEKVAASVSNNDLEQLWKKGIVTAINSKLSEMKKLKDDIDAEVNQKVDGAVKRELAQFKVLLESQKALTISSNTEALEDKQKEITLIIDSKISELKKQSSQLLEGITKVEAAKKEQEESLQKIQTVLTEAKKTKAQLMIEMNSELIKAKSDAQSFIDSSEKHIKALDDKVNRNLQLEKNIADGLVQEAEQKIEKMTLAKTNDLIEKLEIKLNNIEVMEKKINPDKLEEKIMLLDEFKKQFLANMQENLTQINNAIREINTKNEEADKLLASKTLAIDAKIQELTKFEKTFTDKMSSLLKK